ncbi:MAG: hypothetical protein ACJAUJ_001696 [Salibacteraceae bacterium]|jgi:hypothetical protein
MNMVKFKFGAWLFLASIFIVSGIIFWGVSATDLPNSGGKSGVFMALIGAFSILLKPAFSNYSVSAVYFLISVIPSLMAYLNFKNVRNKHDSAT